MASETGDERPGRAPVRPDLRFRPDVDGLRAVAVVAVILFHADIAAFAGGFVGVDVFFVISGYLITQRVVAAVERDRFSPRDFYRKRVRRLLPAASATVIGTLLLGMAMLPAYRLRALGVSAVAASTSWANVLFWSQSGYWDAEVLTKPLLHFWSLSVEEQFYLLWPITLLLLVRRFGRRAIAPIVGLGLVSAVVTGVVSDTAPGAAFYLTPFRAHEFLLGAGCVWLDRVAWPERHGVRWARVALLLGGLAAIVGAALAFDDATVFPGWAVLLPTVGAVAVILSREPVGAARLLDNPLAQYLGRTSYSLYLVHWPLLVIADHVTGGLAPATLAVVLAATVVLAGLQFRHVEQRFRIGGAPRSTPSRRLRARPVMATAGGCAALGVALAAVGPRLVTARADAGSPVVDIATRPVEEVKQDRARERRALCQATWERGVCGELAAGRRNLLVLGDSQGPNALNLLRVVAPDANLLISNAGGCPVVLELDVVEHRDPDCEELNQQRFAAVERMADRLDLVLVAMRLTQDRVEPLHDTLRWLRDQGVPVAVVGVGPEYDRPAWELALDHGTRDGLRSALAAQARPGRVELDRRFARAVRDAGATYLDRMDVLCPRGACRVLVPGADALTIHDNTHMTREAARWLGQTIGDQVPLRSGR